MTVLRDDRLAARLEAPFPPVVRSAAPVREQAVAILREALADGRHFAWHDRLIERDLCNLLATSRTTVREALRQLEAEGLVTVVPGKGPIVAPVTPSDARSLYEVRTVLEALACRRFARTASGDEVAGLQAAFNRFRDAAQRGSVADMLDAKDDFYRLLFRGARNEVAERMMLSIYARVRQLRSASLSQGSRPAASVREVGEILRAIKRRDPEAAEQSCIRHGQRAADAAIRGLEALEEHGRQT